jgi:DNA-binding transcriptional LysR family regulator
VARGTPLPPSLTFVEVARSPICVVMGRGHPLARSKQIGLKQLVDETLLCFSVKKGYPSVQAGLMRYSMESRGLKHQPIRQIDGVDAFTATLESGLGVSLVPESSNLLRGSSLVLRPLKETGPDLFIELQAIWRTDQTSALTKNFVDVLLKVVPKVKRRGVSQ